MGNASWQTNVNNMGLEYVILAPQKMARLGINYHNKQGLNVGLFNSYFGESGDLTKKDLNITERNPVPDAYNLLTANVTLDLNALRKKSRTNLGQLSLYLDNILHEKIYSADLGHRDLNNSIPHHWGFGAYLTYTLKF